MRDVRATRLLLTCGLPGAGKTTLAERLAEDRGAVRLSKDEWLWDLGSSPWDRTTGTALERRLWLLAQEILRLDQSVVIDFGLWARAERDAMRTEARRLGVGVELHFLDVPTEELWRRIDERNATPPWNQRPIRREDLEAWQAVFQAPDADELSLFDPPLDG